MSDEQTERLKQWHLNNKSLYEGLRATAHGIIENLIKRQEIDYLSVTSRAKTLESFLEKCQRKSYKVPEIEISDLVGIRIITYIERDVTKVSGLIESSFKVHYEKSLDKIKSLGIDRLGYRSVHYVCDIGEDRAKLPELSSYTNLLFEIQVRTVLQHAWAEIEHDRNYKFSGVLPTPLQRRLYILAGVLEMVDSEFDALAGEVDRYSIEVVEKTRAGDLNIEINTASLTEFLYQKIDQVNAKLTELIDNTSIATEVFDELKCFGVKTLYDLDKILPKKLFNLVLQTQSSNGYTGILRDAMMYRNIDRYFEKCWRRHWGWMDIRTISLLESKYGKEKIADILRTYQVDDDIYGDVEEDDDDEAYYE